MDFLPARGEGAGKGRGGFSHGRGLNITIWSNITICLSQQRQAGAEKLQTVSISGEHNGKKPENRKNREITAQLFCCDAYY